MTEEFNLSDKIEEGHSGRRKIPCFDYLSVENVKTFIKKLKYIMDSNINYSTVTGNQLLKEAIDKLAGEELSK